MGEIAALASAFDSELTKALAALPDAAGHSLLDQHEVALLHQRSVGKLQELVEHYTARLPVFAWAPRLLTAGSELARRRDHRIASSLCFERITALNLPLIEHVNKLDTLGKLALHVQALYGQHTAAAAQPLAKDPRLGHADTLAAVLGTLKGLKAACMLAMPHEQLYWLVHDATVHIHAAAEPAALAGFGAHVCAYYVFAAKALEAHVALCTPRYLPWTVQLYAAAARCYSDLNSSTGSNSSNNNSSSTNSSNSTTNGSSGSTISRHASTAATGGSAATSSSNSDTAADPKECARTFLDQGMAHLDSLIRVQGLDPVPPPPEVLAAYYTSRSQLAALKAGLGLAADATPGSLLRDAVKGLAPDQSKLKALLGVLCPAGQRTLRQKPLPEHLKEGMEVCRELAAPALGVLAEVGAARDAVAGAEVADTASGTEPMFKQSSFTPEQQAILQSLPVAMHQALLCAAYHYSQAEFLQQLLSGAKVRVALSSSSGSTAEGPDGTLEAVAAVLEAAGTLQQQPGADSIANMAACLAQHSSRAAQQSRSLVQDAALALHTAAAQQLQGNYCLADRDAESACHVLYGLHCALEAAGADDAVLRGATALRLALLLEESGELETARAVLQQALAAVETARSEALTQLRGRPDEHLRWISASRTQPSDATAELIKDMTATEQDVACLHADLLSCNFRVELAIGCQEQRAKAEGKKTKLLATTVKRDAMASVFGARTTKERRQDEARVEDAVAVPSNPVVKERELLLACGKNSAARALLLLQMAPLQAASQKQLALLQEAADLLEQAQEAETAAFASMQPPGPTAKREAPLQPKVLCRTPTSVTLTHFPLHFKGQAKRPERFAVYCKPSGAGVALTINKTAAELPGTGTQMAVGSSVTVEGLSQNETYVFAIAAYDAQGTLIGSLGTSSPNIITALPLPLFLCWAQLLLVSSRLSQWAPARRAAAVLLPRFVQQLPQRPLWAAHPMDSLRVQTQQVEAAAAPLLRLVVQAMYAWESRAGSPVALAAAEAAGVAREGAGRGPAKTVLQELSSPALEAEVALMMSCKRLLVAMQVAAMLHDEQLLQEGALRAHNLLLPLLATRDKTALLHQALCSIYLALSGVKDAASAATSGQAHQRTLAARAAATASYNLLQLSSGAGCGDAAATVQEPVAAKAFARLDSALLQVFDGRVAVQGQGQLGELVAAQDAVLQHQDAAVTASPAAAARLKDPSDLAAAVLPKLQSADPLSAAWPLLQPDTAHEHTRWVELCVRTMEAALSQGRGQGIGQISSAVAQHVRLAARVPVLEFEKWTLEAGEEEQKGLILAAEAEPAKPDVAGMGEAEKQAVLADWEKAKQAQLQQERRRTAAAILLQRRLPALLHCRRLILSTRQQLESWTPWLARMNCLMGLAAAEAAKQLAATEKLNPSQVAEGGSGDVGGIDARPASRGRPGSREAGKRPEKGEAPAAVAVALDSVAMSVQALQHFARAAQLCSRRGGESWHELLNSLRSLWNAGRALLNADERLTQPTECCSWQLGPLPAPRTPPLGMEGVMVAVAAAAAAAAAARGSVGGAPPAGKGKGGGTSDKKAAAGKGSAPSDKKGGAAGGKGAKGIQPEGARNLLLPVAAQLPSAAPALRAAAEALMDVIQKLRDGASFHPGAIPLSAAPANPGAPATAQQQATHNSTQARPATGASVPASAFSFGSDLVVKGWFEGGPIDMAWATRLMLVLLTALRRMERWGNVMTLGQRWMSLTDGAFNERLLPLLLEALPRAGGDIAPLQTAMDAIVRDKSQALDQLDKVRALVRERLGDAPLLAKAPTHRARKRSHRSTTANDAASRRASTQHAGAAASVAGDAAGGAGRHAGAWDGASMVSGVTARSGATLKSKASQPDHLRLPAEYERVIEVLKKRGEKAAMIMATNELGDVYAHFGMWQQAGQAWSDALDTLIGPYQVIRAWRRHLDGIPNDQLLRTYGLHGLLLAATLLGKLGRYIFHEQLASKLEAARMAARLVAALFCSSVVHPQRALGFAGYTPVELWPGVDVWADPYRCNITDVLSGLETAATSLIDNTCCLEALPLLSLWEHCTRHAARQPNTTTLCRITRARALCSLGLLPEAAAILSSLIHAKHLPNPDRPGALVLLNPDGTPLQAPASLPAFNGANPPGHSSNKACLDFIADAAVAAPVAALYGPWLCAQLAQARAGFLAAAGQVRYAWSESDPVTGDPVTPEARLPESVEGVLLDKAAALLHSSIAGSRSSLGLPPLGEAGGAHGNGAAHGSVGTATGHKGKAGHGKEKAHGGGKGTSTAGGARGSVGGSLADTASAANATTPGEGNGEERRLAAAQHYHAAVTGLLQLSALEGQRWEPQKGLEAALESRRMLSEGCELLSVLSSSSDDEIERHGLGPHLWLRVQLSIARLLRQLRHGDACGRLVVRVLGECQEAGEYLLAAEVAWLQAGLHGEQGAAAAALNAYGDLHARFERLGISGVRLAGLLLDHAALRERLGLKADADRLGRLALKATRKHVAAMGLAEMQEHPELLNIYSQGTDTHISALLRCARSAARIQQLSEAEALLREALALLPFTRCLPTQQAEVALELGRVLRVAAMIQRGGEAFALTADAADTTALAGTVRRTAHSAKHAALTVTAGHGEASGAATAVQAAGASSAAAKHDSSAEGRLAEARQLLCRALSWAVLDGGCCHLLQRACLLELAAVEAALGASNAAAAMLRSAHAAACKQRVLRLGSHVLAPVVATGLPAWLLEHVTGQERAAAADALAAQQQHQAAAEQTAVPEAVLGRLAMCHYARLAAQSSAQGAEERQRCTAQMLALHGPLKAACATFVKECCWAAVPVAPAEPSVVPAGTLLGQWHVQEGCWQVPASWRSEGSLIADPITDAQVLALKPSGGYATLLYTLAPLATAAAAAAAPEAGAKPDTAAAGGKPPAGQLPLVQLPLCGEAVVELGRLRRVQRRVRDVRQRLESPAAPSDLFGAPAPTEAELAAAKHLLECCLAAVPEDDMPPAPTTLPEAPKAEAAAVTPPPPPAGKPAAAAAGKAGAGAQQQQQPQQPAVLDWRQAQAWVKVEALLDPEDGLELVDGALCGWLLGVLQQRTPEARRS